MDNLREIWRRAVWESLKGLDPAIEIPPADGLLIEVPPKPEMGDLAFPMFPYSRSFKRSPGELARQVVEHLDTYETPLPGKAAIMGPYVNVRIDRDQAARSVLDEVERLGQSYGLTDSLKGERIMCEFSCPNTNKPLHLGHLRNDCLGESISRILTANGAHVSKVNLINDRGVHICKSMLAYQKFSGGSTPEEEKLKPDHFVGKYYVKYDTWSKGEAEAEGMVRSMLLDWEAGDPQVTALWKKMNSWAVEGIQETYNRTGIEFDRIYFESETYLQGKKEVLRGLEKGVFYRKEDGSIWADLTDEDLDHKVLLRADGTSLYVTQDIGSAITRYGEWPFDRLIYVVASEQKYHFQVLFKVLKRLGFPWSANLYHLAYGMVNLPEGKMKSREGTVVDADDLLDTLHSLALKEIREKGREDELENPDLTAERIAIGALNYYLLQPNPGKDMTFSPAESISFTGNTGPYLQYTGARISSVLRKAEERASLWKAGTFDPRLLKVSEEWELIKLIASYPQRVEQAGNDLNPSLIANYLYELAKIFNKFYHDNPILHNEEADLVATRIHLIRGIKKVLENGLYLLGIPFLEQM